MIGDTLHDYTGSKLIGIDFMAVTYGFGFKSKPDYEKLDCIAVVDTPLEIIKALND